MFKETLLVAMLGMGLAGCVAPTDPPPTSIYPIDKAKLVAAESNLKTDPTLSGCVIRVSAQNDLLVMDGDVPSETAKAKAEELVRKVDGIKKVANHLKVVPQQGAEQTPQ